MPKTFTSNLLRWYHLNRRDLPWRRTKDPYYIWVSEMMLQQTTVASVIPRYERWFIEFPTVSALATAPLEKVIKAWQGLGYYARARNLHRAADMVMREYGGVLPRDPQLVRKLPGFGPYTTASVLSIAYDVPLVLVDANVRRVIMRFLGKKGLAVAAQDKPITKFLETMLPKKGPGDFNQALMELGALICKPNVPLCDQCPLKNDCVAFLKGIQESIPQKQKKLIIPVHAAVGLIRKNGKIFLQQRQEKGLLAGMWELPGGKLKEGEAPRQALIREVFEEIAVKVLDCKYLFDVVQYYTKYKVRLSVFECNVSPGLKMNERRRWVTLEDLHRLPLPSGTKKIFDKLNI